MTLFLVMLAGCSGVRPYQNAGERNLVITTRTDSGSVFSKTRASVDIYRVSRDCRTIYQGSIDLKSTSTSVALPGRRESYLVFVFASSGFLSNRSGQVSYDSLLRPAPQAKYTAEVSYLDDIYNVQFREKRKQDNGYHEVSPRELNDCSRSEK